MRAREFTKQNVTEDRLNEIYKMPPTNNSSQGMTVWAYNDSLEKKSPVVYKNNNVIIFKANEDLLRYIVLQDGNPVLYIGLSKFLDGYKSGTVATEMAGRGKGLAQQAYLNASDILGVPIYSDSTQTDASRLGIWDKLIQQYSDRIVGYDQKTNKNLPLSMTDKGPMVNQNQPIYVDRNKKDSSKPLAPNQRYRTRILKLLPSKKQGVTESDDHPKSFTNNGLTWTLEHRGSIDGKDLGAGGLIDIFKGYQDINSKGKFRWFIRGQRTGVLRPVSSEHTAIRKFLHPNVANNDKYKKFTEQGNVIGYKQGVAEDSLNEFAINRGDGDDDNRPQRPMLLADVAKIIKTTLGAGWAVEHFRHPEKPEYIFMPIDETQHKTKNGMAKIWSTFDPDQGENPVYWSSVYRDVYDGRGNKINRGEQDEVKKLKTVTNALVTARRIQDHYRRVSKLQEDNSQLPERSKQQGVAEDTVDEMALQTYKTMGDFSKPGPFKDPDYKLVTHPVHIQKVAAFFEKTPQDFRFFMSNLPGMRKYQESGEKTPQEIQQMFGEKIAREILQDTEDAITVIYIGNYGQNKVMMSPHTMAHRVGHAITATGRYERSKVIPEWTELYNHFFNQLKKIVVDCYQRPESNRYDYFTARQQSADMEAKYMALMYQIGTLKSSRERNLNNTYEFLYEMLAQYIRTGKVTLNPLPISAGYGRLVGWKTKSFQKYIRINSECSDELYRTEVTQRLARDMGILFEQVLGGCVGKIFVM